MPTMQLIEPVDLLGQPAKIKVTRSQLDDITKVVQSWMMQGNSIDNLTMINDKQNDSWVVMGLEIRPEKSEELRARIAEAQKLYREQLRLELTMAGEEWYSLRVTESVQVGGMG